MRCTLTNWRPSSLSNPTRLFKTAPRRSGRCARCSRRLPGDSGDPGESHRGSRAGAARRSRELPSVVSTRDTLGNRAAFPWLAVRICDAGLRLLVSGPWLALWSPEASPRTSERALSALRASEAAVTHKTFRRIFIGMCAVVLIVLALLVLGVLPIHDERKDCKGHVLEVHGGNGWVCAP